jgi:hypothetical protein
VKKSKDSAWGSGVVAPPGTPVMGHGKVEAGAVEQKLRCWACRECSKCPSLRLREPSLAEAMGCFYGHCGGPCCGHGRSAHGLINMG